jgi:hypothetical protein
MYVLIWDSLPFPLSPHQFIAHSQLQLLRADEDTSPPFPLARWHMAPDAKSQRLDVFDDACTIPGLFDAFVLALIVLQSGQPLGDMPDCLNAASPRFFGTGDFVWG